MKLYHGDEVIFSTRISHIWEKTLAAKTKEAEEKNDKKNAIIRDMFERRLVKGEKDTRFTYILVCALYIGATCCEYHAR